MLRFSSIGGQREPEAVHSPPTRSLAVNGLSYRIGCAAPTSAQSGISVTL